VLRIDQHEHARSLQEGVSSSRGALVEDNSDILEAPLGRNQLLCDGCGDQTPGLNEDLLSRGSEGLYDGLGRIAAFREWRVETDLNLIGSCQARSERDREHKDCELAHATL